MAEYIKRQDFLNDGRKKINEELTRANTKSSKAESDSSQALLTAIDSMDLSESVKLQLEQIIIEGDSSVEAAAARVDEENETHDTLKDRIDDGFTKTKSQLAETRRYTDLAMSTLATGERRKIPIVSIQSDDGSLSDLSKLHPLLDSKGVSAGLGIITSRVGADGHMDWGQIHQMHDYGYEIMSHSHTHQNLREMTDKEIEEEVRTGYELLVEQGFNPKGFIYPFNADNETTRKIVGRYFSAGYTKTELPVAGINWDEKFRNQRVRRVAIGSYFDQKAEGYPQDTSSLEYYKSRVDETIEESNWLVLVIHPGSTSSDQWEVIEELIDYIQEKNIPILNPTDALAIYGNILDVDGSKGKFVINNEGEVLDGFGFNIEKTSGVYRAEDSIKKFPDNRITVSYVTSPQADGFPKNSPGILTTYNISQTEGFQKQVYMIFNTTEVWIRGVFAYGDNKGDWEDWKSLGNNTEYVPSAEQDKYTPETLPKDFPNGKTTVFSFNANRADGAPKEGAGTIETISMDNGSTHGYDLQKYYPNRKSEMWTRTALSEDEWDEWVEIG